MVLDAKPRSADEPADFADNAFLHVGSEGTRTAIVDHRVSPFSGVMSMVAVPAMQAGCAADGGARASAAAPRTNSFRRVKPRVRIRR
jgi:hypothetical protein